jgi:hypothetical protein
MPWTELDYMVGLQLKEVYPNEIVPVNAMYTHGTVAIISTRKRYGGFAKAAGMLAMTTPHCLGYCKLVIVVDEDVDPFNLPQISHLRKHPSYAGACPSRDRRCLDWNRIVRSDSLHANLARR